MANFEKSLLERLKQHEPDPSAALPSRRRSAPVVVAATAVLAALAAAVLPSLGDNGATAHAVTRNPDGTVSVSWKDLRDLGAANQELRDLGVTNIVIIEPSPPGTCAPQDRPGPGLPPPDGLWEHPTGDFATIRPELIPTGTTVLLVGGVWKKNDYLTVGPQRLVATQERYCDEAPLTGPPNR